jgi:hypothetical protein
MKSRFGSSLRKEPREVSKTRLRRERMLCMSERQLTAYLIARDIVRRIRDTSTRPPAPLPDVRGAERTSGL